MDINDHGPAPSAEERPTIGQKGRRNDWKKPYLYKIKTAIKPIKTGETLP
jgi:hypothetical protein